MTPEERTKEYDELGLKMDAVMPLCNWDAPLSRCSGEERQMRRQFYRLKDDQRNMLVWANRKE